MPKERKQRGRRKKKEEEGGQVADQASEQVEDSVNDQGLQSYGGDDDDGEHGANFFGLLDESEQTYFKTIDDAMIADEFTSTEERDIFVENVFKEAEGKELKLATSPLGSKVLEQLLARSKPAQVCKLFKNYQGNFHTLVRQRYASHVCEMLFAIASSLVSAEMSRPVPTETEDTEDPYVSTENLFLYMFNEISGDIATLGADIYASHVIRDTLLILQGTLFIFEEAKGQAKRYHGQKKFSWARPDKKLPVPSSFKEALESVMSTLEGLPSAQLRMTASQPYSVSFVQVLIAIEAEIKHDGERPILFSLLGSTKMEERDDYMESILREPSGSKLFETIIASLPASHFPNFFETYFQGRAAKFAHNPITNFVLQKLIVTCQDSGIISTIKEELSPILKDLVQLNHMQVIQKLVEACIRTKSSTSDLFRSITVAFDCGPDTDQTRFISAILETPVPASIEDSDRPPSRRPADVDAGKVYNMQGVFLIKSLLEVPEEECHALIVRSIVDSPPESLISYAKSHAAIKVLDAFLRHGRTSPVDRKRVLNAFFGSFVALACDVTASHFVDACWSVTDDLKLYKDRIAQELVAEADAVRGNYYGRIVWRNWHMDLYKNKRGEWHHLIKQAIAKHAALARIHQSSSSSSNVTTNDSRKSDAQKRLDEPQSLEIHAARASMIERAADHGGKKEKKRKHKRKEAVEDEVDDIFKKRKV